MKTKRIIYGCDWNYCNEYSLVSLLPDAFKLTIDKKWLEENIYGNGSVNACHTCSNEICGNQAHHIKYDQCALTSCNNPTTCSLYNVWYDIETDELCYRSECTKSVLEDDSNEDNQKYKVQVEAIVYLSQNHPNLEIWKLNINCAAYDCTRSSIFQEVKVQIRNDASKLTAFSTVRLSATEQSLTTTSTVLVHPLSCYNCSCTGTTCPCTTYEISSADNTYCSIVRRNLAHDVQIEFGHININTTYTYIRDYPYVLIEESIIYKETSGRWDTRVEFVIYGCDWNLCNKPELVPYLPTSFQMRLPEAWLNSTILGTGQPAHDCHVCSDGPVCSDTGFIDDDQCPIQSCNTTCLVSSRFIESENTDQCYESYCAPADQPGIEVDTHRVEIEAVLYASRPTNVELWEIDLYCRADNCSRPEVFQELQDKLILQTGDITIIFNQTDEEPKIRCFDCYCEDEQDCSCNTVSLAIAKSTYCTITRNYDGDSVHISFSHYDFVASYFNVRELPYVIVDESILYDNETGQWFTRINEVVYGCNWDYCNKPSLLPLLSSSLQIRLPDSWLNSSILGTEQPVHYCHECANDTICSLNETFDVDSCPVEICNSACFVSNKYNHRTNNEQCYQSSCVPENIYYVQIQGAIYPSRPTNIELREVNIYCQGDNCSRPEIFQEIEQQLIVESSNISLIFNQTSIGDSGQLHCYECFCKNDPICTCNKTVPLRDNLTFCTIVRLYDGQDFWIISEHIDRNSPKIYIREFPFLLVGESILYNEANGRWNTRPDLIMYGCNTDFCNDPRLVPKLPISFQMRLSQSWLNSSILGTGQSVRDCHECPDAPQCGTTEFLDPNQCPIHSCNTTCHVADTFNDPTAGLLCYQSFCEPPDSESLTINPYRVEIEGILYGNRPNAKVELWEAHIYCRADNCTRADIFKDLRAELVVSTGDLSPFFNITIIPTTTTTTAPPIKPALSCYECACYDNPACPCNTVQPSDASLTYCTIVRINYETGHFTVDLEHIDRNSTRVHIRKFPFLLAKESILYNETTKQWTTRTNILVYGCNWHLCNHPSLVTLLPNSFKMTLSDEWLNENVLDSGASIRDCHECPDAPQCGTTDFLDASRCPVKECNNTCVVSDLFDEPSSNLLCYQSYCSSPEADIEENQHRIELEGIIYGDQPDVVELWEIDLYCRAEDCSRAQVFNEIRENLTLETNNFTFLLDNSSRPIVEPEIICYDCSCYDDPNCTCDTYTVSSALSSYCTIVRENFGEDFIIFLEHINRNSTRVYIREFPHLLVEESIIYDEKTGWWNTRNNMVIFGCNWDYCNDPRLLPYLPTSFQMGLPEAWLNSNVLGSGQPVRDCHECPDAPQCGTSDFLDSSRCPIRSCNTTCYVSDTFDDPATDGLCYQSFCAPPDSEFFTIDPHRVELEGIIYASRPGTVELWEIDLFCRADDCSRPELFKEIRQNLCVILGDYTLFLGNTSAVGQGNGTTICPTITTNRTTRSTTTTSRTTVSEATTYRTTTSGATTSRTTVFGTTTSRTTTYGATTSRTTTSKTTTSKATTSKTTTSRITTSRTTTSATKNATTSTIRATVTSRTTSPVEQTTTEPHETTTTAESGSSFYIAHDLLILSILLISLINLY
ncbi:unnamed protein product [Rotaria sp. Silwood2]|nr:unnamed protein product [Rotaria sp. Silwood2]